MLSGAEHAGLLCFTHPQKGKFKLELFTPEDARIVFAELPKALGEKLTVNVEWSDAKQRFVKKA